MRFIAFSDFHGEEYNYENAKSTINEILQSSNLDFVIICGDLTTRAGPQVARSLLKLADFPIDTYFVFGNMDYFEQINQNLDNAINLHLNPIRIEDCDILGIGGDTGDIRSDIKKAKEIIKKLNSRLLILVSHVAPYMHCDLAYNDRHIGSKELLDLIENIQKERKILVCCGHVHEQWTCNNRLGNAEIWNIGPKGILFEIEGSEINSQVL